MSSGTMKQWVLTERNGNLDNLKLEDVKVPAVGPHDVLVKVQAASLNFRDHAILHGMYPFPLKDNIVPLSDGAGEIVEVGSNVTKWKKGDKVLGVFSQGHQDGPVKGEDSKTSLGGAIDGVAAQYVSLPDIGVVAIPEGYSYEEAASLPCAAVTAWNALYGLVGRQLIPGQWVLTQGTGGVSMFGVQFAKAAGARVIATTSSSDKEQRLKAMGADHVINYKSTPQWGDEVRKIVPEGVHHIIEVGGPGTLEESLKAIRPEGVISMIGFVANPGQDTPQLLNALLRQCIVRGIWIGSRVQTEQVVAAIDANKIKPVIDDTVFSFKDLPKAYQHMAGAKHVGKIVVNYEK